MPRLAPVVEPLARLRDLLPSFLDVEWYDLAVKLVVRPLPAPQGVPLRPSTHKVLAFDFQARVAAGAGCVFALLWGCAAAVSLFDLVNDRDWRGWPGFAATVVMCGWSLFGGVLGAALRLREIRRVVARSIIVPARFTPAMPGQDRQMWRRIPFRVEFSHAGRVYQVTRLYRKGESELIGPTPEILMDTKFPGAFLFKDLYV